MALGAGMAATQEQSDGGTEKDCGCADCDACDGARRERGGVMG